MPKIRLIASTDIVTLSSSQLAIARVPLPLPTKFGANQAFAWETDFFDNLRRGKYPAIDEIPTSDI